MSKLYSVSLFFIGKIYICCLVKNDKWYWPLSGETKTQNKNHIGHVASGSGKELSRCRENNKHTHIHEIGSKSNYYTYIHIYILQSIKQFKWNI